MIIDVSYIKTVLEVDVEEQEITYLIKRYFNEICNQLNITTTLEEQEISVKPISITVDAPMLGYNETSLFQDALIYAIACHFIKEDIEIRGVPLIIFEQYSGQIDEVTYCSLYEYCIEELRIFLQDDSSVSYIRKLLNLDSNIKDSEIDFLIEHYTRYLKEIIPDVNTESEYFKQAVYMLIACHIFRTNPESIATPSEYTVDEVTEIFSLAFDKFGNTWCDLAEQAVADLKKQTYKNYGVKAFDRPGARTKYNAWGPT